MIPIHYQDDDCVVVSKPTGMLMHRSFLDPHAHVFLMQTLREQLGQKVYLVHRLDRPTSGLVLLALHTEAANALQQQFQQQQVQKSYWAMVRGWTSLEGVIDYPLKPVHDPIADKYANPDAPAQSALSTYCCLAQMELPFSVQAKYATSRFSWLALQPHTGRKHQLRRHLKHIFHPIIGDTAYGDLKQNRAMQAFIGINRLWLHAHRLQFQHLRTHQPVRVSCEQDADWLTMATYFQHYTVPTQP